MGKLSKFQVLLPENLTELFNFLNKYSKHCIVSGGGTQLIPDLKNRLLENVEVVISLSKIEELNFILYNKKEDILEIGSMITLFEIINSKFSILSKCAKLIAAPAIQNKATIGGNICLDTRCLFYNQSYEWRKVREVCYKNNGKICNAVVGSKRCFAVFCADLPPLLIALDAEIEILSADTKYIVKLKDFYTGKGKKPNILKNSEIVSKVIIKDFSKKNALYEKFRIRNAIDYPLAGVAVGYDKTSPDKIRVVLNAVESGPVVLDEVYLKNNTFKDISDLILKNANPVSNMMSTPEYRKEVCVRLFKKIILNFKL